MYNYIKGNITEINPNYITVENNGIGYQVITPNPYAFILHTEATVYLYQKVSEDNISLFGFKTQKAKELFIKLISVNGIGPKSANAILASGSVESIADAIEDGNAKYLQKFPGIGPKASQQIILDLKGKIEFEDTTIKTANLLEVEEALVALGYKDKEIKKIIPKLDPSKLTHELIKDALAMMLK
ncbi:MAG: Holliday junction branch migration protein RuvA [Bacilli bacterium]|nr:Holliday junction branch migration protein RuvA [Bacilli bacterium]MBN2876077.1 Holliday junction branch migration protein RuvA [Bacilli bacterium]